MKINSSLRQGLATAGLWLLTGALATTHAQPSTGGPSPQAPDPAPTAVPLDGGASLLAAAGAAWGLRKLRRGRRAT